MLPSEQDGVPMGSPVVPIVANLVLNALLDSVIPSLRFHIPFLYKYVDDMLLAIPSRDTDTVVDYFKKFHL